MIPSSSNKKIKVMSVSPLINWAELSEELISSILIRVDMVEILTSTQRVCRSWRRVSRDPSMWQKIDMRDLGRIFSRYCQRLCVQAIDLSQGGLLDITIGHLCSNHLLTYIADRSSKLRCLAFAMEWRMTNEGLVNAIAKLSLLETLEISYSLTKKLDLKAIGQACPQLQTLKLNCSSGSAPFNTECDEYALEIAKSMPQLRHLQLLGNTLTETGLNSILDNLPHLEHLDLRLCLNIELVGNLEKRCLEKIKELRRPTDSMADYPFYFFYY